MQEALPSQLQKILQNTFGFKEFRPGQLEAITLLLQKDRLLCIQPTGYGKSLLYQLSAVLLGGITLVISPLLALMRDQITQLKNRFGIRAVSINTDQNEEENSMAKQAMLTGKACIVFIAPEQLDHIDQFEFLLRLPINLLVVDEAHCISTWGHDFRPSYRQIIKLSHALANKNPDIKLLGLTATANLKTEKDIQQQLRIDNKDIIIHRENMDRQNIRLSVIPAAGVMSKLATLANLLTTLKGCGLIYCATRDNTEMVAAYLCEQGVNAAAYHAGLETQRKQNLQQEFIQNKYQVIAATNALGMGIDKADLRFVIHFDYPGSITAYYQEVGRCGRDGWPAEGILLYDAADTKIQRYFIEAAQPTLSDFQTVLTALADVATRPHLSTLKRLTGMHPSKLTVVVAELIEQGYIKKISQQGVQLYLLTNKMGTPNLNRYHTQYQVKYDELMAMQHYAESSKKCLMEILRIALGDKKTQPCGHCSQCDTLRYHTVSDKALMMIISSWLHRRTVPISLNKKIKNTAAGISVLDGKIRSTHFIEFMKGRMMRLEISDFLFRLIKECLHDLAQYYQLGCIISLPSTTWLARDRVIACLANHLNIPALLNVLYWQDSPAQRQGELLNNDQRQFNVAQRMRAMRDQMIPKGTILLFDDYIGSGATINEAARALRDQGNIQNEIVPFTIAAVKWRLGKKGII